MFWGQVINYLTILATFQFWVHLRPRKQKLFYLYLRSIGKNSSTPEFSAIPEFCWWWWCLCLWHD